MDLHWNILDPQRQALLPHLKACTDRGLYLAGGTGLALQIGHRDSIDFDFFSENNFEANLLAKNIASVLAGHTLAITQQEKNTLSCVVDNTIQLSFFGYPYPLLNPLVKTEYINIASIADIGCMKLSAITGRSLEKDYIDLYFILQRVSLSELLALSAQKHPTLDAALILKSLVYFDDVLREPIRFAEGNDVSFEMVQSFLQKIVEDYFKAIKS